MYMSQQQVYNNLHYNLTILSHTKHNNIRKYVIQRILDSDKCHLTQVENIHLMLAWSYAHHQIVGCVYYSRYFTLGHRAIHVPCNDNSKQICFSTHGQVLALTTPCLDNRNIAQTSLYGALQNSCCLTL